MVHPQNDRSVFASLLFHVLDMNVDMLQATVAHFQTQD